MWEQNGFELLLSFKTIELYLESTAIKLNNRTSKYMDLTLKYMIIKKTYHNREEWR
jgi:hypothetical protein